MEFKFPWRVLDRGGEVGKWRLPVASDDELIPEEEIHPLMTEEEVAEIALRKEEREKSIKEAKKVRKAHVDDSVDGDGDGKEQDALLDAGEEVDVDFDPLIGGGLGGVEKDEAEDVDFDPLAPVKSSKEEKLGAAGESDMDSLTTKLGAPTSPPKDMNESEGESGNAVHDFSEIDDRMKEMDERQKSYFVVRNPIDWASKKTQILKEYTTLENISILGTVVDDAPSEVVHVDKSKMRLAQLEEAAKERKRKPAVQKLTQKELIEFVETMKSDLLDAWDEDDRVQSLKIVIQACKFLGVPSSPGFYPSLFVLVTEVVDTFGRLVFDRLRRLSTEFNPVTGETTRRLGTFFTLDEVSVQSRDTCRNWMYKVASIRELLPRVFVETALLQCYIFLARPEAILLDTCVRLAKSARGVGDPLVAAYARYYVLKTGLSLIPYSEARNDLVRLVVEDILKTMGQWHDENVLARLSERKFDTIQVSKLYVPLLEYALEAFCYGIRHAKPLPSEREDDEVGEEKGKEGKGEKRPGEENEESEGEKRKEIPGESDFLWVLELLEKNSQNDAVVLNAVLKSFPASIVAEHVEKVVYLIKHADRSAQGVHVLYRTLGEKLVECPPRKKYRRRVIREAWKEILGLRERSELPEFVACSGVYVRYVLRVFSVVELNHVLSDVRSRLQAASMAEGMAAQDEDVERELQTLVRGILQSGVPLLELFQIEHFPPLLDMFSKHVKLDVYKGVLEAFGRMTLQTEELNDPVVVNALLAIATALHNSIDSVNVIEDERRQITRLIRRFLGHVGFGIDFENHLNFLVDARRNFPNLDEVQEELVLLALRLVLDVSRRVSFKHTKKTAAFSKMCIAFCHITIPSIRDARTRIRLFLSSGSVALVLHLVPAAEPMFRLAAQAMSEFVNDVSHADASNQLKGEFLAVLQYVASHVVLVPGHPEEGPLFLLEELRRSTQCNRPSEKTRRDEAKEGGGEGEDEKEDENVVITMPRLLHTRVLLIHLACLNAIAQPKKPPYFVAGIRGNDTLFGGDKGVQRSIETMGSEILEDILADLSHLIEESPEDGQQVSQLISCDVVMALVAHAESHPKMCQLIVKLLMMADATAGEAMGTPARVSLEKTIGVLTRRGGVYSQIVEKFEKKKSSSSKA